MFASNFLKITIRRYYDSCYNKRGHKIIFGLGNPGNQYEHSRHNIGYDIIDAFSAIHKIQLLQRKFDSLYKTSVLFDQNVTLVKPLTFMNQSGKCVRSWVDYFKIPYSDCLVIHDAVDLPFGTIRFRCQGRSGGQNGVKDIIEKLGTNHFSRMKVGIGSPTKDQNYDLKSYVLRFWPSDDKEKLNFLIKKGVECIETFLVYGERKTMNKFNDRRNTIFTDTKILKKGSD